MQQLEIFTCLYFQPSYAHPDKKIATHKLAIDYDWTNIVQSEPLDFFQTFIFRYFRNLIHIASDSGRKTCYKRTKKNMIYVNEHIRRNREKGEHLRHWNRDIREAKKGCSDHICAKHGEHAWLLKSGEHIRSAERRSEYLQHRNRNIRQAKKDCSVHICAKHGEHGLLWSKFSVVAQVGIGVHTPRHALWWVLIHHCDRDRQW